MERRRVRNPKREELLGQEGLLGGARGTPGRVQVQLAAVGRGHARVTPRSFPYPDSSSPRGEDRLGRMVRRRGVSETQEGSEVDALAEYGLSALNPGHTSTTHMDTNTKSVEKALRTLKARLPPRPDMPSKKDLTHVVMTTRKVWMKSIPSKNVFSEDIFSGQKVHLSRPLMSRHLNKDNDDLEKPSDDVKLNKRNDHHFAVRQHRNNAPIFCNQTLNKDRPAATSLPDVEEIEEKCFDGPVKHDTSELIMGCTEPEAAIVTDPLRNNQNKEKPPKRQKKDDEFCDIMDMTEEEVDEPVQKAKEKSLRRRFANWLNEKVKERNQKKIARTNLREGREGHLIYSDTHSGNAGLVDSKMTKGEREQMKRNRLLWQEKKRQRMVESMNKYWAEQREKKEALRLKEEQRYEQWAAKVGLSSSGDEPADRPKKKMTKLEKAALGCLSRVISLFH